MWDQYQIISLSIKNHQRSRVSIQGRGPVLLALLNPGQSGEKKSSKSQMVHSPWHHLPWLKNTFFDVFLWLHGWTFSKYQIQGLESKPFQAPAETCMTFFEEIFLKYRMALSRLWCFSWEKIYTSNFNKINKPQLPPWVQTKARQPRHRPSRPSPSGVPSSSVGESNHDVEKPRRFSPSCRELLCCNADADAKRLHGEPRAVRKGKTMKSADRLKWLEHLVPSFVMSPYTFPYTFYTQEMSKDVQNAYKNPEMTRE